MVKLIEKFLSHVKGITGLENTQRRALFISIIVFFFLLMPLLWYSSLWYEDILINDQKAKNAIQLTMHGNALTTTINERFAMLEGLFAFVMLNPSEEVLKKDFDLFASGLYTGTKGIRNYGIAPGGVMQFIYPLEGNKEAIGHDLVNEIRPEVRADVQRTIKTQKIALSGPYELKQGGLGLVARKAVYVNNSFWGLVTMVIDMPPIFSSTGLYNKQKNIELAIRGSSGNIIFGNGTVFENEPVIFRIVLPEGYWEMGGIPKSGWKEAISRDMLFYRAAGFIVSLLLSIIIFLFISRYSVLETKVIERTQKLNDEITEHKIAKQSLTETKKLLESILDNSQAVIYLKDLDGHFLMVNSEFEKLLQINRENIIGKTDHDFFPKDLADNFRKNDELIINTKVPLESEEIALKNGSFHTYISLKFPIWDAYGSVIGTGGVSTDITERKKAEEALRKHEEKLEKLVQERTALLTAKTDELVVAKERAEAADRLKSAFLSTMSHELRTPLNSIIGFTGFVLEGLSGPLTNEQKRQLEIVKTSAYHLLSLINDVLDLSKIEAGYLKVEVSQFEMRRSIEKVVETVSPLAEKKGLMIKTDISPEVRNLMSDQRRVEQILFNLLSNAIKFTEKGEVKVECNVVNDQVIIRIIDTGIGVKPENIERLFKPFLQLEDGTSRRFEGTGLGLSICKRLVEALGGKIWVESELGKGSIFTFTLQTEMKMNG